MTSSGEVCYHLAASVWRSERPGEGMTGAGAGVAVRDLVDVAADTAHGGLAERHHATADPHWEQVPGQDWTAPHFGQL